MTGDLLTLLRAHDLPPRWDGHAVWWEGWHREGWHREGWHPGIGPVFICPPPRRPLCCEGCGSLAEPVSYRGLVAVWASLTPEDIEREEENRRRLGSLAHKRKRRAYWRLRAYRCPDCKLDTVWDIDTDDWWTLDHTDYSDDGSETP